MITGYLRLNQEFQQHSKHIVLSVFEKHAFLITSEILLF